MPGVLFLTSAFSVCCPLRGLGDVAVTPATVAMPGGTALLPQRRAAARCVRNGSVLITQESAGDTHVCAPAVPGVHLKETGSGGGTGSPSLKHPGVLPSGGTRPLPPAHVLSCRSRSRVLLTPTLVVPSFWRLTSGRSARLGSPVVRLLSVRRCLLRSRAFAPSCFLWRILGSVSNFSRG